MGINPTTSNAQGIFFVEDNDFATCFSDFEIAHYRDDEGYSLDWYDKEADIGVIGQTYTVTVPAKSGDLYINADTYYDNMKP